MLLFFTDRRKVRKVGQVAELDQGELTALLERRRVPNGMPMLLDEAMRPVEPLCSWFRRLAMERLAPKTMKAYAHTALMLLNFLHKRDHDLRSATEQDIRDFEAWRREDGRTTVEDPTWDRDSAAIGRLYAYLVEIGYVAARPWRRVRGRTSLGSGMSHEVRVRHMELEQYLFCRDVGFGGLLPTAELDESFRGWSPHRNRAASELALLTGMRIEEWSTLLLPELGLDDGRRPATWDVALAECAKGRRPRSVYIPAGAMAMLDPYLLIERPEIVAAAQRRLRRRHRELFVVDRLEAEGTRVRGTSGRRHDHAVSQDAQAGAAPDCGDGDGRRFGSAGAAGGAGRADAHAVRLGPGAVAGVGADKAVDRAGAGAGDAAPLLGLPRLPAHLRAAAADLPDPRGPARRGSPAVADGHWPIGSAAAAGTPDSRTFPATTGTAPTPTRNAPVPPWPNCVTHRAR
ncbi:site-specific integrase [Streptomyces cellulosae]